MEVTFPYKQEEKSLIFGEIYRPLISLKVLDKEGDWYEIKEVLVDSGADFSLLPKYILDIAGKRFRKGRICRIKGVTGLVSKKVSVHKIKVKISDEEFDLEAGFVKGKKSYILGRYGIFNKYRVSFDERGENKILEFKC